MNYTIHNYSCNNWVGDIVYSDNPENNDQEKDNISSCVIKISQKLRKRERYYIKLSKNSETSESKEEKKQHIKLQ